MNVLVAKPQGERISGKSKHRCEDNIETHLKNRMPKGEMGSFDSRQVKVAGYCEHGNEHRL